MRMVRNGAHFQWINLCDRQHCTVSLAPPFIHYTHCASSTFTKNYLIPFFAHIYNAVWKIKKNRNTNLIKSNERQFILKLCWHCQLSNQHFYHWFWCGWQRMGSSRRSSSTDTQKDDKFKPPRYRLIDEVCQRCISECEWHQLNE